MFVRYPHLERFGNDAVDGINLGKTYVFPKIDGTNASVWMEGDQVCAGSRNRKLSLENDNAGFYAWVLKQQNIRDFLFRNPGLRLYGEWLVPHTIKHYREDSWGKFYVFDVFVDETGHFVEYDA